ncbi:MAG: hypothetical protein PWQ72_1626 [Pseudothermotoga sp.]|nr:hypothetical protein [Pseudothermotoga sp.]
MSSSKKIDPRSMKRLNKQLILRHLIERGPRSRIELVAMTGLANSAIWRITEELIQEGLIEQKGYFMRTNTKRASVYGPTKAFATSLIIDVQVLQTTVALGFLDGSWEIISSFPTNGFEEFLNNIDSIMNSKLFDERLRKGKTRMVFSLPGIVDGKNCTLLYAPNLKWHNVDFREHFARYGFEILIDNDSNLSLLGESFFAKDIKNSNNAFFLYLGEGVGGALLINSNIVKGSNFAAGEIGHSILMVKNTIFEVEELLSISKLVSMFEQTTGENLEGSLKERFDAIVRFWLAGDKTTHQLIDDFLKNLVITIRNIGYFMNPEIIVFGGAVSNLWETFGSFIEKELLQIDIYGFLRNIKFRDTIFKSVSPSLPGCNITAINKILEDMNNA